MKIVVHPRKSGKTVSLIRESVSKNIPIICQSKAESIRIIEQAKQLGYSNILTPLSISEVNKLRGNLNRICLVDNADNILENLIGCRIDIATFTDEESK